MFIAYDADGNRVYAESADKSARCFCPECGELLRFRSGHERKAHFAHLPGSECHYGEDKNYKSPWHIRMQSYFPRDYREVRFVDEASGERHIADIYVPASNMVLEFQHSPISEEEFMSRTLFHIHHGRRIAWLFDETPSNPQAGNLGRFKPDDMRIICGAFEDLYRSRTYKWLRNPRHFLSRIPTDIWHTNALSICVYTGAEGDVFHRLIAQDFEFENVVFSLNDVTMNEKTDVEDFFRDENYWQERDPWKEACDLRKNLYNEFIARQEAIRLQQEDLQRQRLNQIIFQGRKPRRWRF